MNRFTSPSGISAESFREPPVDRNFLLSVTADSPQAMMCERVAATIVALENQGVLRSRQITSRIRFDHLVGMGYVEMSSGYPGRDDWSKVKFTGKDGIRSPRDLASGKTIVLASLLRHQNELLQKSREHLMIAGAPASDRQALFMSAAKGVSWVDDFLSQGCPPRMLEEIPGPLKRIIDGVSPEAILRNHRDMEKVDPLRVYQAVADDVASKGLPVSFDRMVGMGMIPMSARMPESPAEMTRISVTIATEDYSLMEVVETGSLREAVGTVFISEVRDDLMTRWEGSEIISPDQAVAIASVAGSESALRAAEHGPQGVLEERVAEALADDPEAAYRQAM